MPGGKAATFNNEYLMNSVVATGARSFVDCRTHEAEVCAMAVEGDAVNETGLGEGRLRLFQDARVARSSSIAMTDQAPPVRPARRRSQRLPCKEVIAISLLGQHRGGLPR